MTFSRRGAFLLLVLSALLALGGCRGRIFMVGEPTLPAHLLTQFPAATASLSPAGQTATAEARMEALVVPALTASAFPHQVATVQAQLRALGEPTRPVVSTPTPETALVPPLGLPQTGNAPAPPGSGGAGPAGLPADSPFLGLSAPELAAGEYGLWEFRVEETWERNRDFTRFKVRYQSGGLRQYAFLNVPAGTGPFPVVIVLHDGLDPPAYSMLPAVTTRSADALARAGYIVLHPNLRGFPPGDDGPNLFNSGYTIDTLNLVGYVQRLGGQPGPLQRADPQRIGLFGHGLGAEVALRAVQASPAVSAAVLYSLPAPALLDSYFGLARAYPELERSPVEQTASPEELDALSPFAFLRGTQTAISLHHGSADPLAPAAQMDEFCTQLHWLTGERGEVRCFSYRGEERVFSPAAEERLLQRAADFFARQLAGPVE